MKKKMLWMLAMLLLLVSAGCSDDSKSDSDNGQKGGETVQVADDFESRADWLATAYKKTKPMIASVWNATVNPDDFVMLFVSEDMKTIYLIPIIHEPRIYRKLMVQSLINALNNKGSKTENYSRAMLKACRLLMKCR